MKLKSGLNKFFLSLVILGLSITFIGCNKMPKGTMGSVPVGSEVLEITGAGIVKVEGDKTTIQIKCGVCGYVSEEIIINTPSPDKPYTFEWKCPRCGHKQMVVAQVKGK